MSFLSNIVANRRLVLLCARLLAQCVMGWSTAQTGMDDLKSLHVPHGTSGEFVARHAAEPIESSISNGLAVLRRTGQRHLPG